VAFTDTTAPGLWAAVPGALKASTRPSAIPIERSLFMAFLLLRIQPERTQKAYLLFDRLAASSSMRKGNIMWVLVLFTFATTGAASGTVTTLEFSTQQLCLIAARELQALTKPVISGGLARYEVVDTCVQTSEATKK
jgi:hypothetical protein